MKFLFDFDDTLWDIDKEDISIENIKLLNKLDNAVIISGNTFESIKFKIEKALGSIDKCNIDIWADYNTTLYRKGKPIDFIEDFSINSISNDYLDNIMTQYNLLDKYSIIKSYTGKIIGIKIKPLSEEERSYLVDDLHINNCKTVKAGRTTIDILNNLNNKCYILQTYYNKDDCIYFGDEIEYGNDNEIAYSCKDYIKIDNIEQINRFLKRGKLIYGLIISAGNQSRFKSTTPKALVNLGDFNLLDINISEMKPYVDKIYIVCSYNNEFYFSNYKNRIVIESGKGCGDAVMQALAMLHKDSYSIIKWRRFTTYK